MIIIMSTEQAESAAAIARDYPGENVVLFSPELTQVLADPTNKTLSFYGHGSSGDKDRVTYFGCESPTSKNISGFTGYTPEQFVAKLMEYGLTEQTQRIELWGCGIGDRVDGYSYAGEVALLLAKQNLYPEVLSISSDTKDASIKGQTVLTHDFDYAISQTHNWQVRGISASSLNNSTFIEIKENMDHYAEEMGVLGKEIMDLRAQVASASPAATTTTQLTADEIEERLDELENKLEGELSTNAFFDLIDNDHEDLRSLLVDDITNYYDSILREMKKDSPRETLITQYNQQLASLEEKLSAMTKESGDSFRSALTLHQQRIQTYQEQIGLLKLLKNSAAPMDTPISAEKQLRQCLDKFQTAQNKLDKYVHSYLQYYRTIEEFRDIRAHMTAHADCRYSVARRNASIYNTTSPTTFHIPAIAVKKDDASARETNEEDRSYRSQGSR